MIKFVDEPILSIIKAAGAEPDQRMAAALAAIGDRTYNDDEIFLALCRQNFFGATLLPIHGSTRGSDDYLDEESRNDGRGPYGDPGGADVLNLVMNRAMATAKKTGTFGARDFLRVVLEIAIKEGNNYAKRPFTADLLTHIFSHKWSANLSNVPEAKNTLRRLRSFVDGADDFQYFLALDGNRLVFRIASTLDDFVQEKDSGLWTPRRALLTHLGGIGFFTSDEIGELEKLLNNPLAREAEFQAFFERHPHFLRKWDHREVHPHVYLTREEDGPLIPDFILTDREAQHAAIVDLKRAHLKSRLIRRQSNRKRFADAVMEARAQLLEYRDWFDLPDNRRKLASIVGMQIYRPRLMVIIGRASEFQDEIEHQKLRDRASDIEVVTYDDIVRFAKRRMMLVSEGQVYQK